MDNFIVKYKRLWFQATVIYFLILTHSLFFEKGNGNAAFWGGVLEQLPKLLKICEQS